MSDYPSTPSYGANYGSREQANPPYLPPSYPNQYMQPDNGRGAQGQMAQNYDASMSAYAYNGAVPSFNSAAVASGVPPLPIFQGWHQDPTPLPPYNPQQNSTQYPPPNNNSQFVPQYYPSYNHQSYPSNVQTPKRYEQGELSEGEFEDNGQATNTPPVGYGASHYPNVATNYGDSSTPTGYSGIKEPSTQSYQANNHTYPRHPSAQLRRQQSGSYSPYVTSPAGDYDEHHNDHRPKNTSANSPTSQHQASAPLPAQGRSPPSLPAFPSQAAPRNIVYHNPPGENKAVQVKSSTVDSTLYAPANQNHDKILAESRKKAEAAVLDLSSLDIRYQQYVEEGLGEGIIGPLFDRLKLSRNSTTSMNSNLPATSSLISQVKIGHSVGQQATSPRTEEQRKPEQLASVTTGPHIQQTQSPASTPESAAMTEKKRTLQFKMEALKKSREERAKNAAAAKDAKQGTKPNATSPVNAPVPAVAAPIPPPVTPVVEAPEREVDVQQKPVPASFDSPSDAPFTPKPQIQIPINPSLSKSPAPTVVPQLRQQPSIPGLFLASNSIPGLQQSTSNIPVSSTSTAQRKRPIAADFDDPIPAMTPFKRPFGHQRNDQQLVINVSDESEDEDEDVATELDSGDQDSPVLPVQPEQRYMSNHRLATTRTSAQASSKPWTPPPFPAASNTPPSSIPGLSQPVRHADLETSIKELKRQIAEKEAKKKAKQTPSRARTPRLDEGSGSRELSTANGIPPSKIAHATEMQQMVTIAQNQVNTDQQNLIDAQAAEAEKAAELHRNEQEQKRLLREQNAANQSLVDAEVLQSRSKLEELRAAMAEAEAAYSRSLEEKRKLKEEADRLEQEAELQTEKDREKLKEVAIKQPPPATDQHTPSTETVATTTESPAPTANGVSDPTPELHEQAIRKPTTPIVDNETAPMELDPSHNLTNGTQHFSSSIEQHGNAQSEEATLDNAPSNQALEAALQEAVRADADADAQSSDKGDADIDVEMEIDMEDSYAPDPSHLAPESISGMSAGKEDSPSYSPVLHRTAPQSQDQEDEYEPPEATEPVDAEIPDSPPFSPAPPDFVPETTADEPMDMSPVHPEQHDAIHEQVTDEFDVNPTQGGPEEGHGAGELLPSVIGSSPKLVEHGSEDVFETPKFTPYESPLKRFRAFRFHPEFNHDISGGLRSKTYSHKIDPNKEFCRFELSGGVCNDTTCDLQHFKDIVLPDDAVLTALGSPEEFKDEQRDRFCSGLKGVLLGLRVRKIRDFDIIASEIVAHRAKFLGDKSKVLALEASISSDNMATIVDNEKPIEGSGNASLSSEEAFANPTGIDEKALVRRLDLKLLPPLTLLYLLSFLDRSNIGNAKLDGLTTDLHITGNQYLLTLTIYFVGYVLFEIPCNIILKRTTPKIWLPTLMLIWGIVATLMGTSGSFAGIVVARFFLGVTESGLFPGVVFYLSMWYKRTEVLYRVALFFSAASLAGAFGGILAYGIGFMKGVGGYNGWRWIFIIEGLLTVVISLLSYLFIHNYPSTAPFLTEPERSFIHARLKHSSDANNNEPFTWSGVRSALTDYKCWLYGLAFHTMSLPLYTLSLFLPTIIKTLGYSAANAQLLTVPPYAVATILTVIVAILSEKTHLRSPFILASTSLAIVGYILLLSAPIHLPGLSYAGTILAASGIYPSCAIVLSWAAANVSGQTKRATATAMTITIGNLGAVLGTQLYRPKTSPRWFLGHGFAVGYLGLNLLVVAVIWFSLGRENSAKERRREAGEIGEGQVVDDADVRWVFQR